MLRESDVIGLLYVAVVRHLMETRGAVVLVTVCAAQLALAGVHIRWSHAAP